ncbi:MAG: hypothetical protein WB788_06235, partial [Thermoplasmata archaeon]
PGVAAGAGLEESTLLPPRLVRFPLCSALTSVERTPGTTATCRCRGVRFVVGPKGRPPIVQVPTTHRREVRA